MWDVFSAVNGVGSGVAPTILLRCNDYIRMMDAGRAPTCVAAFWPGARSCDAAVGLQLLSSYVGPVRRVGGRGTEGGGDCSAEVQGPQYFLFRFVPSLTPTESAS